MSALSSRLLVFVLASFLLVGTTRSVVGIGYVKAEDSSGSSSGSSDSGSGGDSGSSNGGGSSDSNSGGSSNDKGSNDNNNNDNGDKGPKGPSKEDTKDLTSDDPNVEPNIPKTPEVCAGSCGPFNENPNNPVKPLPIVDQSKSKSKPSPTLYLSWWLCSSSTSDTYRSTLSSRLSLEAWCMQQKHCD